jgi:hypothetical protein
MKKGRTEGKSPRRVEMERAQVLKTEGIRRERQQLREAVKLIVPQSKEICLGIMASSYISGIKCLNSYTRELSLPKGLLYAYDLNGQEISLDSLDLQRQSIYMKYNSSDNGNVYVKPYKDDAFIGVIFQPRLQNQDDVFYQYGDLPLQLFE